MRRQSHQSGTQRALRFSGALSADRHLVALYGAFFAGFNRPFPTASATGQTIAQNGYLDLCGIGCRFRCAIIAQRLRHKVRACS